jgi:F0F1-type ATP synthase assembly protein I
MVPSSKKDINGFALYVELASLGVEMVAPITVGAYLDTYFSTKPIGIVSGIILGVLGVSFHIKKRLF